MKNRTKLMAWSPLAGGKLFTSNEEKYIRLRNALEKVKNEVGANGIDEIAYAWLLNHPANIMPICGSGNFERVQSAINAINIKLTRKQWFKILDASRGFEVA
ncbi:MAG: oxidoreductase [Fusobacteriales bacterium]|jgi:predicted oxidoreductase|nr:oxidoreductase [Fusobacteriales bacterium]